MTYLALMQQKYSPGAGTCHSPRIVFYGDILYLSIDLTHFVYKGRYYQIKYKKMNESRGVLQNNARGGLKGPVNVDFRKFIYDVDVPEETYLVIVQTNNVNTYLHNQYELTYVMFEGMRFEMVFPCNIAI